MKFKNKGRKIYKTKERNYYRKRKSSRFMSVGLTILLTGGLVFVGYSVAEPLLNYSKKQGDNSISSLGNSINADEMYNADESSLGDLEDFEELSSPYKCTFLSRRSLDDIYSLEDALDEISDSGVKYVAVPLKISGGRIYYSSGVRGAEYSGAVVSYMELDEIVSAIEEAGLKSIAYMCVLDDNIYPASYPDAGYRIDESGSIWLDNSPDNGGKPWLNPFSYETVDYVENLADEITLSGFDKIIYSGIEFPPFRQSDLDYIGETVKESGRYTKLVTLANELCTIAENNGIQSMLEVAATDVAKGNAEVLHAELLSVRTIVVNINFDELYSIETADGTFYEFNGDNVSNAKKIMRIIKDDIEKFNVVVRLSGDDIYEDELEEVREALVKLGYKSYILN